MALAADFAVETVASLVGAFGGVFLALLAERRGARSQEARARKEEEAEYARARDVTLTSVMWNTAEASRIRKALEARKGPLLETSLETGVWEATREPFVRFCRNVDERIRFAGFFDEVARLKGFLEFHRGLEATVATARLPRDDPELSRLLEEAGKQLALQAQGVRMSGFLLITDYGKATHRRMLGIQGEPAPAEPAASP